MMEMFFVVVLYDIKLYVFMVSKVRFGCNKFLGNMVVVVLLFVVLFLLLSVILYWMLVFWIIDMLMIKLFFEEWIFFGVKICKLMIGVCMVI